MPYQDPDPSDPSMLVGVGVECSEEELVSMAASFSGELAQMGYDARRILALFREPFYAGPHLAWRALGEERVRRIVEESTEFWSHCRMVVRDRTACASPGSPELIKIEPERSRAR